MTKRRRRRQNSAKSAIRKAWTELSAKLREDRGCCEVCGSAEKLNAHHCIHRRARKGLLLEERNIVVLCARHHFALHHGHEAEFFAWMKERKPDQFDWVMRQASLTGPFST